MRLYPDLPHCGFIITATVLLMGTASASDWPQFRGPQARGISGPKKAPTTWDIDSGKNILWKHEIPGLSLSSPIVHNGRVYITSAQLPDETGLKLRPRGRFSYKDSELEHYWKIYCFDARTGKEIFEKTVHKGIPKQGRHATSSHCNSTPAMMDGYLVTIFSSDGLFCFDPEGELLWHKDLGPMHSGSFKSPGVDWGFASSPVIHQEKVVVQCDVKTNAFLALYDIKDGREIWKTPRKDRPTWGTPAVAKVNGKDIILVNGWTHIGAYDFKSGKEIWKTSNEELGGDIPVPTPVIWKDLGFFMSAHGKGRPLKAIRLDSKGDLTQEDDSMTSASIKWANPKKAAYLQTPIIVNDLLYTCMLNGAATCFEASDGEIKYSNRLSPKGKFSASPVSDGQNIFFANDLGEVVVLPATGEFSVSERNQLGEGCYVTPALADGVLYFKTMGKRTGHLVAVGHKK